MKNDQLAHYELHHENCSVDCWRDCDCDGAKVFSEIKSFIPGPCLNCGEPCVGGNLHTLCACKVCGKFHFGEGSCYQRPPDPEPIVVRWLR